MAQIPVEAIHQEEDALSDKKKKQKFFLVPFILACSLFLLWGMVHNFNSVLIPHLKKACQLNNRASTLIDTSVYLAYFLMAIPAGIILKKWGYKKGMIGGLVVAALGAFLFVPAANSRSFELFLLALFVIGCGIATLETAANPYVAVLGPPKTASIRLNFGAAINGLAVVIAPIVGSTFILTGINHSEAELNAMPVAEKIAYLNSEAATVKMPYIILGCALLVVVIFYLFFHFPEVKSENKSAKFTHFFRAFRHRHLTWAVIAQFAYVGAQVCVTSFFIRMAQQGGGFDEKSAGYFLGSVYGTLFLVGRFAGTFILRYVRAEKLLTIYAVISTALCAAAILGNGGYVVYCLGALGFFMSIMFPTIFGLGLVDLGEDTKIASSLLVMSIVGGAIFPFIMGTIIDLSHDKIQPGYIVPLICFLVIVYFGVNGYKVRKHEKAVVLN
jgi:FHS family L-fucose permease-like MFS transporter